MKDVNDLMQAILEMDAAQRRESEKARARALCPAGLLWTSRSRRSSRSVTPARSPSPTPPQELPRRATAAALAALETSAAGSPRP